ncbi:hypothetical protein AVEN_173281-1 [Araneus ventricosus]|uniref:Uncharacterized protein n=1 Tax=Araneus ventricosus TaxID=182803 RepID=A0A4Y2KLL4_ARAVE|nr:hypothetical protein AVEN_173281-1 [Araneus ventricosus]
MRNLHIACPPNFVLERDNPTFAQEVLNERRAPPPRRLMTAVNPLEECAAACIMHEAIDTRQGRSLSPGRKNKSSPLLNDVSVKTTPYLRQLSPRLLHLRRGGEFNCLNTDTSSSPSPLDVATGSNADVGVCERRGFIGRRKDEKFLLIL